MGRATPGVRAISILFILPILFLSLFSSMIQVIDADYNNEIELDGPLLPLDPEVWVEVEHDSYVMYVEPGNADVIVIKGWAHCDTPPGFPPDKEVFLHLDILGSFYHIQTLVFTFDRSKDVEEFEVEIPPILEAMVDDELYVRFLTSWYTQSPERTGTGGTDEARIYPAPYGSVHVQDMDEVVFDVGEFHKLELIVENNGNCEAHISMSLEVDGDLEVACPGLHFVVQGRNVGYYPYLLKQKSGTGTTGKLKVTARSNITGLNSASTVEIKYRTRGKALAFLMDPIVYIGLIMMIVLIATVFFIVYNKMKKRKRSIST